MSGTSYDQIRAQWRFQFDSYCGGERYRYPSQTHLSQARTRWIEVDETGQITRREERDHWTYLLPHPSEQDEAFTLRLRIATYINVVQPIVDAYAEATTTRVNRTEGSLSQYLDDVDRQGTTWGEHVEDVAKWAAVYGWVAVVADTPRHSGALSRAAELAQGVRPYACVIHPPAIAWTEMDALGRLKEFAYVDETYRDTTGSTDQCVRLRVLRLGAWELREVRIAPGQDVASAQGVAGKVIDKGTLPEALGGEIPVAFAYYKKDTSTKYPLGMSLIADASDIGRAIYNELSWISEIHRHAGFPFLAIPLERTGGQLDAPTRVQIGPQKALPYSATAGAPGYVQPSSESPRELREHCVWLFQIALRSAGIEMAADQSSQVQSGEALRVRSRDFEARAARYARNLQRYEERMLGFFAALAGVPRDFKIAYPQRFTLPDPSIDLQNAIRVLTEVPIEIGVDAKVRAVSQIVRSGLDMSDADVERVAAEVRRYFEQDRDRAIAPPSKPVATVVDNLPPADSP